MITSGRLPCRGGLFERNAALLIKVEEFFDRKIVVTELVYSQRVLLIGLTLSSRSTCTFVRPFKAKASESETMRQRCGSVISPIWCRIIKVSPIISTLIDMRRPLSVDVTPAAM